MKAVLFDLDGTLLDTAQDMVPAINQLRAEEGLPPLPFLEVRSHISRGAARVVELAFSQASVADHAALVERFLGIYESRLARETRLFEGMPELLDTLAEREIPWGIVTNKPSRFTDPLLRALHLTPRARVIVSGDTLAERKPSATPLLHAVERMGVRPEVCLFLGDAEIDIQAAKAAGMLSLGARYGYISPLHEPASWGADAWIDHPLELLKWLGSTAGQRGIP